MSTRSIDWSKASPTPAAASTKSNVGDKSARKYVFTQESEIDSSPSFANRSVEAGVAKVLPRRSSISANSVAPFPTNEVQSSPSIPALIAWNDNRTNQTTNKPVGPPSLSTATPSSTSSPSMTACDARPGSSGVNGVVLESVEGQIHTGETNANNSNITSPPSSQPPPLNPSLSTTQTKPSEPNSPPSKTSTEEESTNTIATPLKTKSNETATTTTPNLPGAVVTTNGTPTLPSRTLTAPKKPLLINVESSNRLGASQNSFLNTPNHRGSTIGPKANVKPNKSKLMALTGEALPTNALDPTGYENHEEEAKRKKEELSEELKQQAIDQGLMKYDQFGNAVYTSMQARIRVQFRKRVRGCWKVYDPTSLNRQYWSILVCILLLYGVVEIPIRVGFELDAVPWSGPDILNLLVDIFFLCDVFINFRTGFYQEDSRLILDERKIAIRYLKSWFLLDIITSVPISQILQAFNTSANGISMLSLPRILRIFRIARLFKILRILKLMTVMSNWTESSNEKILALIVKVMKFVVLVFLLSHLSGCIWGFIAMQQKDSEGNFYHLSWPYRYGIYNYYTDTSYSEMYLLSIYWALCTLTTLGYGDIHAGSSSEYAFCIILTFVGTCLFGYIIGTISTILKHGKEMETLYQNKMTQLNLYMIHRRISPFLQKKIRKHYEYLWKRQTLYNEEEILNELPTFLKSDLSLYLYKDLIQRVPFLSDMSPDCAMLVILKLKPLQFTPGSYIFTKGASGREMYFVSKGTVEIINGNGYIICQLHEGSYVGEYSILSEKPVYRTASVRARTFVDLLSLSKTDFDVISTLYSEIYAKIILRAKEQWQKAIQESQAASAANAPTDDTNKRPITVQVDQPIEGDHSPTKPPKVASPRLRRTSSQTTAGDTVIRIEKSEEVGSERKLVQEKHNNTTNGGTTEGDHTASTPRSLSHNKSFDGEGYGSDGGDGDYEELDNESDLYEPSYVDSLEGFESENDEDYDVRLDYIDLPDHLLPPPKPKIVGSFVANEASEDNDERGVKASTATAAAAATTQTTTLTGKGGAKGKSPAAEDEKDAKPAKVTTAGDGATLKDLLQSHAVTRGTFSPMMQEALLSPAEERQLQRRKLVQQETRATLEAEAAAVMGTPNAIGADSSTGIRAVTASGVGSPTTAPPNGSHYLGIGMIGRVRSPSAMIFGETDISTIREADDDDAEFRSARGGTGADDVSRVGLLKKQHMMKSLRPLDITPMKTMSPATNQTPRQQATTELSPSTPVDSPRVISTFSTPKSVHATPLPPPLVIKLNDSDNHLPIIRLPSSGQSELRGEDHSSVDDSNSVSPTVPSGPASGPNLDPAFWQTVQSLLSDSLAPLQSQYDTLLTAHSTLQQKQQQTEQLLRSVVEKLQAERLSHQATMAKFLQTESSPSSTPPLPPATGVDESKKSLKLSTTPSPPSGRLGRSRQSLKSIDRSETELMTFNFNNPTSATSASLHTPKYAAQPRFNPNRRSR